MIDIDNPMIKSILSDIEVCINHERANKKRSLAIASLNAYYRTFNIVVFESLKSAGMPEEEAADVSIDYTKYYMKSKGYIE